MTQDDLPVLIVEGAGVLDHLHLLVLVLVIAVIFFLHLVIKHLKSDDDYDEYDVDHRYGDGDYMTMMVTIVQ